ncbi:hypothetical protein GR7B_00014 [Vibrio phage vB_VcorM_GR7B]|nr:hypothetical protein GR7B_00014 [Vibrio phage vB_VcorM_GR7B]
MTIAQFQMTTLLNVQTNIHSGASLSTVAAEKVSTEIVVNKGQPVLNVYFERTQDLLREQDNFKHYVYASITFVNEADILPSLVINSSDSANKWRNLGFEVLGNLREEGFELESVTLPSLPKSYSSAVVQDVNISAMYHESSRVSTLFETAFRVIQSTITTAIRK